MAKTNIYYGYVVVKNDDGFYKIKNAIESTRVIPQELSVSYPDEDSAVYALHRYYGQDR